MNDKKEEKNVRYPYVAVNFDGTLCENAFPEIGEPKERCIEYVKRLAEKGSKIILHTCRENGTRKLLDEAVTFCNEHGIPLYAVNENPDNQHDEYGLRIEKRRNPYADLYIDDKAVNAATIEQVLDIDLPNRQCNDLPKGGKEADSKWTEVMRFAERQGFIMSAFGGVAMLATNQNQLEQLGLKEYLRIQRMNGRCPKVLGAKGCIDSMTGEFYCSNRCELYE